MSEHQVRGRRRREYKARQRRYRQELAQPSKPLDIKRFKSQLIFLGSLSKADSPSGRPSYQLQEQFRRYGQGSCLIRWRKPFPSVPKWQSNRWRVGQWIESLVYSHQWHRKRPKQGWIQGRIQCQALGRRSLEGSAKCDQILQFR